MRFKVRVDSENVNLEELTDFLNTNIIYELDYRKNNNFKELKFKETLYKSLKVLRIADIPSDLDKFKSL